METKFYRPYTYWISRVLSFLFFPVVFFMIGYLLLLNQSLASFIVSIFILFTFGSALIFIMHVALKVGVNEEVIMVQVLWVYIRIPWDNVISIGDEKRHFNKWWFVRTDALPFYFMLYGALIRRKFERGLLIFPGKNVDELIAFIEGKI